MSTTLPRSTDPGSVSWISTGAVRSSTRTSRIWGAKPSAWTVTIVGPAVAVLQGELAPLVRRPGRRVGTESVVADDGPGSFDRPARGVDDPPGHRQPLREDDHAVEVA